MKLSKEMLQEIADSNYDAHDYIFFQEDGEIVFVPEFERNKLTEVDGSGVIFNDKATVYNLSSLLDNIGIEEPKTGDEYIVVLNAVAEKLDNLETSSDQ